MDVRDDGDSDGGATVTRRPLGALETLGDALTAAFDEEMARWRGAAQSYCATLRDETQHCHHAPKPSEERVLGYAVAGKSVFLVDDDDDDDASVGMTDPQSQSDASAEFVHGASDATLADKWAALEGVLASLRPTVRHRCMPHGQPTRVLPLTSQATRRLRSEIGSLRSLSYARGWKERDKADDPDKTLISQALCKKMLDGWAETTRANAATRAQEHIATLQWRRWRRISVLHAWRSVCVHRRTVRERDRLLTHAIQSRSLHSSIRQWWVASRWSRGQRCLKRWSDTHRLEYRILAWKELVGVVRHVKKLHKRALTRRLAAFFVDWRRLTTNGRAKRERAREVRVWMLRRYLCRLVRGTSIAREQRRLVAIVRQRRTVGKYQRVFEAWTRHTEASRKTTTAIEWRRHCLLSASYEAWNLLHRCFVYHRQITTSARAHYAKHLATKLFMRWRVAVIQRRRQREALQKLIKHSVLRCCLRHLQAAVRADHHRASQLLQWKARRCISNWHRRAHDKKRVSIRRQAVQRLHRERLLRYIAWSPWQDAYACSLQTKRQSRVAHNHVRRKWWRRWKEYESLKKARHTMQALLDDTWKRKKQRWAIRLWRRHCDESLAYAAKVEVVSSHRSQVVFKSGFAHWRSWVQDIHTARQLEAKARERYCRLLLLRWRRRAAAERSQAETRVIQILHRRPMWRKRLCLSSWKKHSSDRIRCRQLRLFRLWREYAARAGQFREAQMLERLIRVRRLWLRWGCYTTKQIRAREASQLVVSRRRLALLSHAFHDVWRSKALRFSQARRNIQLVLAKASKRVYLDRWRRRLIAVKQTRQAADRYHRVLRHRYFDRLHQYCILRPQNFLNARALRIQQQSFHAWKTMYTLKRMQRCAQNRFIHWKKLQAIGRLRTRVTSRRHIEQHTREASALHRRSVVLYVFERWQSFATRMATCRAATQLIRLHQRCRVFASWRHAFARQVFVRDLESQYDQAQLRRSWLEFVQAIQHKHEARDVWLSKLSSVLQRKAFGRWRQLVDRRRVALLEADWLYVTAQRRLHQVAFDEWVHFTAIRAFVHLRQRRESDTILKTALRSWKLFVIAACRRRLRGQRGVSRVFMSWKRFALVREAAREITGRSECTSMASVWKTWRVEFWIRQSHATVSMDILRRCMSAWRSCVTQSHRSGESISTTRRPTRRATAFDEALVLQHVARHQRLAVRRVLHAWALVAHTCKRQRRQTLSVRPASALSLNKRGSYHLDPAGDQEHDLDSSIDELWDQENADPNARRSGWASQPVQWDRQDNELAALEFWSSRVLETTFHAWRTAVERACSGPSTQQKRRAGRRGVALRHPSNGAAQ